VWLGFTNAQKTQASKEIKESLEGLAIFSLWENRITVPPEGEGYVLDLFKDCEK